MAKLRGKVADPLLGRTLPGGHVVLELIEVGGMGRIYRAEQKVLGRTVAVKIIHPHLLGDETVEARFVTEARAASQLNHPNTVGVIDFGKIDGRFYMVMEYLRGEDLARVAHKQGPLDTERVLDILRQVLAALEEAHHHGIVHRDLKPENIVLETLRSGGDFVKVLDFGLAKVREAVTSKRITSPGMVCGTPEYMAPEQSRGDEVDHRVDLYACGVLLYELLAGRLPFNGRTAKDLAIQHQTQPVVDPRELAPDRVMSDDLVTLVLQALAKRPEDRFQSAEEMGDALRAIQERVSTPPSLEALPEKVTCHKCGADVPRAQKFCGDCGALMVRRSLPPSSVPPPPSSRRNTSETPLLGRDSDLAWLFERCQGFADEVVGMIVVGDAGVGKTRLLSEFLRESERHGDLVCWVGPDPWRAAHGYAALRSAIEQLAEFPEAAPSRAWWAGASAEASEGLEAIMGLTAIGPPASHSEAANHWSDMPAERQGGGRRAAAAEALRWALGRAARRAKGSVIVAIDDLHDADGASANAFLDVLIEPPMTKAVFVATHRPSYDSGWLDCDILEIAGFSRDDATALVEQSKVGDDEGAVSIAASALRVSRHDRIAPLYVEQLIHFLRDGGGNVPPKLVDLIAARLARLPGDARRVLQAVAVLGRDVAAVQLIALLPEVRELRAHLRQLERRGFVSRVGELASPLHPLIGDVALAATPVVVRQRLHDRARRDLGVEGFELPIEARAMHAYHARDAFESLMLLEGVAAAARGRDDWDGVVRALSLALDISRYQLGRDDLEDPLEAVLLFSCKLGDALTMAGHFTDAEGVLVEALNLAGPRATERPRLLGALARVEAEMGRHARARAHLEEAIELASDRPGLLESFQRLRAGWGQ